MQCACIILLSVACVGLKYFSTLSHKWHNFRGGEKKNTGHKLCVLSLSKTFGWKIFLSIENEPDMIKRVHWPSCKIPDIFVRLQWNFNFLARFLKNTQIQMLIKFQPDATVCRHLFTAKLLYMFRVSQHPSSEVLKTVTAVSGTGHNIDTASTFRTWWHTVTRGRGSEGERCECSG